MKLLHQAWSANSFFDWGLALIILFAVLIGLALLAMA